MFLSTRMLCCLEEHVYRVARSTLDGRKVHLTGVQEVKLQDE